MQRVDDELADADRAAMAAWAERDLVTDSVAEFIPGPGIDRLELRFDIDELQAALTQVLDYTQLGGTDRYGFGAIPLTRRPGTSGATENDLSGRYWARTDDTYSEHAYEDPVDEAAFCEFISDYAHTYFAHVHTELSKRARVGRMRVLSKGLYNCNSWHRDPEPRIHVPIITNPGSLFVVNHHATHLPADGSVYYTDTRGYHTAMNGGFAERVHIVASLPQ